MRFHNLFVSYAVFSTVFCAMFGGWGLSIDGANVVSGPWLLGQEIHPAAPVHGAPSLSTPTSPHADDFIVQESRHLIDDIAAWTNSDRVRVVVEIPAGTNAKWEVDKVDGRLKWEIRDGKPRVVRYLPYPGNYGMIPQTLLPQDQGGDGDPLDVLVLGPAVARGAVIEVYLIGVLKALDGGEQDDKLLAVMPDTPLGSVRDLESLQREFPGVTSIVETWFTHYKGPGEMEIKGWGDATEANRTMQAAAQAYQQHATANKSKSE